MTDFRARPVQIDVGRLARRSVASLYSHLVTRPTGRAVRLAIETQLAEEREAAFILVDLSEVTILDFSCADEVVAKLLLRYLPEDRPRDAFFVFRGVRSLHREPILTVLERQRLAAVAQGEEGDFELLGAHTPEEARVWRIVEDRGWVRETERSVVFDVPDARTVLDALVHRRLLYRLPDGSGVHALSALVRDLIR